MTVSRAACATSETRLQREADEIGDLIPSGGIFGQLPRHLRLPGDFVSTVSVPTEDAPRIRSSLSTQSEQNYDPPSTRLVLSYSPALFPPPRLRLGRNNTSDLCEYAELDNVDYATYTLLAMIVTDELEEPVAGMPMILTMTVFYASSKEVRLEVRLAEEIVGRRPVLRGSDRTWEDPNRSSFGIRAPG
ncbi:hypothetical protein KM043_002854 [Ampulex compressa]|nr:hypothetical protein KM043_002854 [Ampulex compressa]